MARLAAVAVAMAVGMAGWPSASAAAEAQTTAMDPCKAADAGAVAVGEGIALGLAVWPGTAPSNWTELHPCRASDGGKLAGASVAYYRVETDTMTVLRLGRADEARMRAAANGKDITVAAFQGSADGENLRRSEARTVFVNGTGRVTTLVLLARLRLGELTYAQWYDIGCGACGGGGERCIDQAGEDADSDEVQGRSCVDLEAECACEGEGCTLGVEKEPLDLQGKHAGRCRLALYVAFLGTDKHGAPLKSGLQVSKLGQYSLTGLYKDGSASGASAAAAAGGQAGGIVDSATSGAGGLIDKATG